MLNTPTVTNAPAPENSKKCCKGTSTKTLAFVGVGLLLCAGAAVAVYLTTTDSDSNSSNATEQRQQQRGSLSSVPVQQPDESSTVLQSPPSPSQQDPAISATALPPEITLASTLIQAPVASTLQQAPSVDTALTTQNAPTLNTALQSTAMPAVTPTANAPVSLPVSAPPTSTSPATPALSASSSAPAVASPLQGFWQEPCNTVQSGLMSENGCLAVGANLDTAATINTYYGTGCTATVAVLANATVQIKDASSYGADMYLQDTLSAVVTVTNNQVYSLMTLYNPTCKQYLQLNKAVTLNPTGLKACGMVPQSYCKIVLGKGNSSFNRYKCDANPATAAKATTFLKFTRKNAC